LNTLFPATDYAYILADSRARAAIVSAELAPKVREAAALADWRGTLIVSDPAGGDTTSPEPRLEALLAAATPLAEPFPSSPDDPCFWLYSSGSTGRPKGAVHVQSSMVQTAELFARGVLDINERDVVFSAA